MSINEECDVGLVTASRLKHGDISMRYIFGVFINAIFGKFDLKIREAEWREISGSFSNTKSCANREAQ